MSEQSESAESEIARNLKQLIFKQLVELPHTDLLAAMREGNETAADLIREREKYEAMPDERLIEIAQQGDRLAFEIVFYRFESKKQKRSQKLPNEDYLVGEAMVAACEKAWNSLHTYQAREGKSFGHWLASVLRTSKSDVHRKEKGRTPMPEQIADPQASSAYGHTIDGIADEALANALSRLPEQERQILNLVAAGLDEEEIADALGISRRGVSYRLWRIRIKLVPTLRNHPDAKRLRDESYSGAPAADVLAEHILDANAFRELLGKEGGILERIRKRLPSNWLADWPVDEEQARSYGARLINKTTQLAASDEHAYCVYDPNNRMWVAVGLPDLIRKKTGPRERGSGPHLVMLNRYLVLAAAPGVLNLAAWRERNRDNLKFRLGLYV
jgi:RNA polymerase sigma factor (sigma-70 family)